MSDVSPMVARLVGSDAADVRPLLMLHGIYGRGRNWLAVARALVARRPDYRTDPIFRGLYDANPLFDPTRDPVPEPNHIREYLRPEKRVSPPLPRPQLPEGRETHLSPSAINPVDRLIADGLLRRIGQTGD